MTREADKTTNNTTVYSLPGKGEQFKQLVLRDWSGDVERDSCTFLRAGRCNIMTLRSSQSQ